MKKNTSDESRRNILKSIAAGSGAIIAGKSLPESWSRPIVDSVMLPAHAQTSGNLAFTTSVITTTFLEPQNKQSTVASLMDSLVAPANANCDFVGHSVCGINEAQNGGFTGGGSYQVMFNIVGTQVGICFSSLGGQTDRTQQCTTAGVTSINGTAIADVTFVVDAMLDGVSNQESVALTGMTLNTSTMQVSGNMAIIPTDDPWDNPDTCADVFVADLLNGSYVCNEGCTGSGGNAVCH